MKFKFNNFYSLYRDMRNSHKVREKWDFRIKDVVFEVIFLIDRTPFELLVGAKGHRLAFVLDVTDGFRAELSDVIYFEICKILNLNYSINHFSSAKFLAELDRSTPPKCTPRIVQPHEIAYYKRNIPEGDKIYFLGWLDHTEDGRMTRNIEKTRRLLGDAVADFCAKNNISSRWTDQPQDRKDYYNPPGFSLPSKKYNI